MIDLTLNSITIPDISGYTPPFGKKKSRGIADKGGLTTREVNNNIIATFSKMRGVIVSLNEETSQHIEHDAKLYINATSSITLIVHSADYVGCTLSLINLTNLQHTLQISAVSQCSKILLPHQQLELVWDGTYWLNITAPAVGKTIIQYPQEKSPVLLYPCTAWEEVVKYNGAFFRTYKENISDEFIANEEDELTPQLQGTAKNGLSISWASSETEANTSNPSFNGGKPTHGHDFEVAQHWGKYDYIKSSDSYTYDYYPHKLSTTTTTSSVSLSGRTSGSHYHSMSPAGTITSDSSETRPDNYAIKLWKRIA